MVIFDTSNVSMDHQNLFNRNILTQNKCPFIVVVILTKKILTKIAYFDHSWQNDHKLVK
jgi:hypothetical protein